MNKHAITLSLAAGLLVLAALSWFPGPTHRQNGTAGPSQQSAVTLSSSAPSAAPPFAAPAPILAVARAGHPAPDSPASTATAQRPTLEELPQALRPLLDQLRHPDPQERAQAVDDLGFTDNPWVEPFVINTLLNDSSAEVRAAAAAALETHDSDDAIYALGYGLTDPDENVREHALLSLSAIRTTAVETSLRTLLDDGSLDPETATDVRVFLDRYYPRKDPFVDITQR